MECLCVYSSPGNKGRSFRELCVVNSVLCDSCLALPCRSHSREHLGCLVAAPLWRCGPAAPNETFTDTLTTQPGNQLLLPPGQLSRACGDSRLRATTATLTAAPTASPTAGQVSGTPPARSRGGRSASPAPSSPRPLLASPPPPPGLLRQ